MKSYTFRINKLCRDKTISRLEGWGAQAEWSRLDDAHYEKELRLKLKEETEEVCLATPEQLTAELADVLEVIDAMCSFYHINHEDLLATQKKRRDDRGGFFERMYVTKVHAPENSFPEKYYRADPDKYPEIID